MLNMLRNFIYYQMIDGRISRQDPIWEDLKGPDFNLTKSLIKRIYFNSNSMTIFADTIKDEHGESTIAASKLSPQKCADIIFGHREDFFHDLFHKNNADFNFTHSHYIKSDLSPITPAELTCMFENVNKFQDCRTKHNCYIKLEDQNRIAESYKKFYKQSLPIQKELNSKTSEVFYESLAEKSTLAFSIFISTFFETLLDHYFRPYLQTKTAKPGVVNWGVDLFKSAITLVCTRSYMRMGAQLILDEVMKPMLLKVGMDKELRDTLLSLMSSVIKFLDDPTAMLNFSLIMGSTLAGQIAAYGIIHQLPKLKIEEQPSSSEEIGQPIILPPERVKFKPRGPNKGRNH